MKKWTLCILLSACMPMAQAGHKGGDPEAGKAKAEACQACHGPEGKGKAPNFPRLAGQFPDYLAKALKDYKKGARQDPTMRGMAAGLSEEDIADLAAYFGHL